MRMSELVEVSGVSRDTINKWAERGTLPTPLTPTPNGVPRTFTLMNALEIAFMGALTQGGIEVAEAGREAAGWIRSLSARDFSRFWARCPQVPGHVLFDDDPGLEAAALRLAPGHEMSLMTPLIVIDRRAILERVERAFAGAASPR